MRKSQVKISKKLVLINSASSVLSRLLNMSLLFWMYQYLLGRITPEEFAIYPVIAAVMAFAPLLSATFTGGIVRYIVDACARGEKDRVVEIHSSSLLPLAMLCMFGVIGGSLLSFNIELFLNIPQTQIWEARVMMFLLVINFFVETLVLPYTVGFDVFQKFALRELIYVGRELLRMAILLILLLEVSTRVIWIVASTMSSNLLSLALIVFLSRRMLPELRFSLQRVRLKISRQLMSFGIWTTLGQLSMMIYHGGGAIVLNTLGTPLDVTNYHLGAMIDRQIMALSTMASAPMQPALTAMHSIGDTKRLGNAYLRGGRYALWASLFIGTPFAIYGDEFVQLYVGDEFEDTAMVIVLLIAAYPFIYSESILPKIAMATARIKSYFIGAFIASIGSVVLMIYSVGWLELGSIGVALSILITCVVSRLAYFWPLGFRLADVTFRRFVRETLVPGLIPSLAALFFWMSLKLYQSPTTWFAFVAYTVAGHAVYVLVIGTVCLQPAERADLVHILKNARNFFKGLWTRGE